MKVLRFLIPLVIAQPVFAIDAPSAIIASVQGTVDVLSPAKAADKKNDQVMIFEGARYSYQKAKVGQKVTAGQVILSSTDGKAKIIYAHGDVIVVGPATSVGIPVFSEGKESEGKKEIKKEIPLMYGKIRGVIDKDGPLANIKIKTPSAVAGVRGTDLFVSYNPSESKTEVQVLRGEVEVKPEINNDLMKEVRQELKQEARIDVKPEPTAKADVHNVTHELPKKVEAIQPPEAKVYTVRSSEKLVMEVKASVLSKDPGMDSSTSATNEMSREMTKDLANAGVQKTIVNAELIKSSKEDLVRVKEETTMIAKVEKMPSAEIKNEVVAAEKKALENVMTDIKRYDLAAGKVASEVKVASVDEANLLVVNQLSDRAKKEDEPKSFRKDNSNISFGLIFGDVNKMAWSKNIYETETFELRSGLGLTDREVFIEYQVIGCCTYYATRFNQAYLEIPISIYKRFKQRWAVFASIKGNMPFGASRAKMGYGPIYGSDLLQGGDITPFANSDLGFEYKFFEKFNVTFQIDVGVLLAKNKSMTGYSRLGGDHPNILLGYIFP